MARIRRASIRRILASVLTGALVASAALVTVAVPATAAEGPAVSAPLVPRAGATVTVAGSGFSAEAFGIYLGVRADGAAADTYTVWIDDANTLGEIPGMGTTAPMNADGSFSVQVPVPAFAAGVGYSIVTRKAHGGVDPTQSTSTPLVYEAAPIVATTTVLSTTPFPAATTGESVTLAASVSPAAPGTVEFFDGATSLGSATVSAGSASVSTTSLSVGTHSLTAVFTPADAAAFAGSTSSALALEITAVPAPDAAVTTTTLAAPTPATRAPLSAEVTLTATVLNTEGADVPVGSVEFFSTAAGTVTPVSAGVIAVASGGTAVLKTSALAAGGHSFTATYTPSTSAFQASQSAASANYGIVDSAVRVACTPGSTATTTSGATAGWGFSGYSVNAQPAPWAKTADGTNITVSGTSFAFANGTVVADAACATVAFDGWFKVEPHTGYSITFTDPVLSVNAAGDGVWTAAVTTPANTTPQNIVFATFTGASGFGPGLEVDTSVAFDYAGATALGTWSAAYGNAWPNAFILNAQPLIQAYFSQSGTSALNLQKGPLPLSVAFTWPAVSTTALSVAPAPRALLDAEVTLTATVAPATAEGSVEFFDVPVGTTTPVSLGSAAMSGGTATLATTALAAGGHTFRAEFTSTNGYDPSVGVTTSNYGVVDPSVIAPVQPTEGENVSGITATWDWSQYAAGWTKVATGNVSVGDGSFVLSGGTGIVGVDGELIVEFTGTLRVEAYQSFFPPNGQWVELVDPTLVIDRDGLGTWSADVRTGVGAYAASTTQRLVVATLTGAVVPDFSDDSVDASFAFDYADTTAAGTWSVRSGIGYTSAWTNQFVLAVPSAIQSFYFATGANGDPTKPPAPLQLGWTAPTPQVTIVNSGASVVRGATLQAVGTGFRDGESVTVVANSDPVTVGTFTADASGAVTTAWTVPSDFATGAHSLVFTGERGAAASAPFTVTESALVPVPDQPAEPACVAQAVSGASIEWGVKQSFRDYIVGPIAKGSYSGGWGSGSGAYNTTDDRGRVAYSGSMTFTGHAGALDMTISSPRIQVGSAGSASLIVTVQSKGYGGAPGVSASGIVFATLALPTAAQTDSRISWSNASATLTTAGAEAFAGFYPAGTALDPVSFAFPLGAEVPCDATTSNALAATGGETPIDIVWLALGMLVLGAGVFVLRRRTLRG